MIAYSLINQNLASKKFLKKFDEVLKNYDKVSQLTELLTHQILICFAKGSDFSNDNVIKYFNQYSELIKKNMVKERSIFVLVSLIRKKIFDEKDSIMVNFYKDKINEFKNLGNAMK
jgi:hypothetical protein